MISGGAYTVKKIVVLAISILLLTIMFGCVTADEEIVLSSGGYYAVGDYETYMTPYLQLNIEEETFFMGAGAVISYAEHGSFEIKNGRLIATSQSTTFIFEIKDGHTLVLTDNGANEYFQVPKNTVFVFRKDLR